MKTPHLNLVIPREIRHNIDIGNFVHKNEVKDCFDQTISISKESEKSVHTLQCTDLLSEKTYLADNIEKKLSHIKSFEMLSFSEAPGFSLFKESHYKYIYGTPDGKLISIMKGEDNNATTGRELNALQQIKNVGLKTPNPMLIEVVHRNKKVHAIIMDKVEGTFVDIAKIPDDIPLTNMILAIVYGLPINISEMETAHFNKPEGSLLGKMTVLTTVIAGLSQILRKARKKNFVINDLQVIIKQDGHIVIIDPLWAGNLDDIKSPEDREEIDITYNRLAKVIRSLSKEKKKQKTLCRYDSDQSNHQP